MAAIAVLRGDSATSSNYSVSTPLILSIAGKFNVSHRQLSLIIPNYGNNGLLLPLVPISLSRYATFSMFSACGVLICVISATQYGDSTRCFSFLLHSKTSLLNAIQAGASATTCMRTNFSEQTSSLPMSTICVRFE